MSVWTAELELDNGDVVGANLWPNQTEEPGMLHFDPVKFMIPKMKKRKQPVFAKKVWVVLNGKRLGWVAIKGLNAMPLYSYDFFTVTQIKMSLYCDQEEE